MTFHVEQWRKYTDKKLYIVFVNHILRDVDYLTKKFNIDKHEILNIVKQYNGILNPISINEYNVTTEIIHIAFYTVKDAENFAYWLESLYIATKLNNKSSEIEYLSGVTNSLQQQINKFCKGTI